MVEVFDLAGHPKTKRIYAWTHDTDEPKQLRLHFDRPAYFLPSNLRLVSIGHPPSEKINTLLRPGPLSPWWGRWHHGSSNSSNAVVDCGCVCLYIAIICKVKGLVHGTNVALGEEWEDVALKSLWDLASENLEDVI